MGLIQINHHPSRRQLALFCLLWIVFFGMVGWFALRHFNSVQATMVFWAIAVAVPIVGIAMPGFLRIVYLALAYAAFPIGFVLSHIILAVVYYGVVTPIGLLMRFFGHNPMQRQFDPAAKTYWIKREQTENISRYLRQF